MSQLVYSGEEPEGVRDIEYFKLKIRHDNPDISKYLGYANYKLSYKGDGIMYSILFRNNLRTNGNKGAVEFSVAQPLYDMAKLYIQYFNGYGESLLDYNHVSNRLSIGILIFNWS